MKLDLVGPGYTGRSKSLNTSRCINLYPEIDTQDGKNTTALIGTPGTKLFLNTGTDVIRGMHVFNDLIYFVSQNSLYSLDGGGTVTGPLGSNLTTARGRVSMANNGLSPTGGDEVIIADGSNLYVWDVNSETMIIVNIGADTVCFISGHFVANSGGGKFRTSGLYDGTSWNALDVATAESAPDDLLAVFANHGELWLLGEYTIEVWYKIATGNPPFNPVSGGVIDYGCAAQFSVAAGNDALFWLGNKRNNNQGEFIGVCMARGYGVEVISPASINYTISTYTVINDAFAYFYTEGGHEFYVLTFPSANATWVYDTTTRLWHERSSYKNDPYAVGRHRGNCYAYYNNRHYVGDHENGNIYEMSSDVYDENGEPLVSQRIFPHLADKENLGNIFYQQLELDSEKGTGIVAANIPDHTRTDITTESLPGAMAIKGAYLWVINGGSRSVSKIIKSADIKETDVLLDSSPKDILSDGTYLWVLKNPGPSGDVNKIDPDTNTIIAAISFGITLVDNYALLYDGTYIWALSIYGNGYVFKINPETNTLIATIPLNASPSYNNLEFVSDGFYVWVTDYGHNQVLKIDPATDSVIATVIVGTHPINLVWDGGNIWVANTSSDTVSRIDPITNTVINTIPCDGGSGTGPYNIIFAASNIWVTNRGSNSVVSRIDPTTNTVTATIPIGTFAKLIIFDEAFIWAVNEGDNTLSKINILTNTVVATLPTGNTCRNILVEEYYLWLSCRLSNEINKFLLYKKAAGVDPQAMLSWSDDGGHTWSNDYMASLGKQGEYSKRTQWRRLGKSRNRVFRLAISDPIKKVLNSAVLQFTGGT